MKKQTRKKLKKCLAMGAVFLIALILYFYRSWHSMERQNTVYSTMEEPSLPVAYVSSGDYLMNPMHAYLQDMAKQAARDMITVLPQDRQLKLVVQEYDNMVASASYEIRTLDLSHLIEKGTVSDISRSDGNASLVLPIQNLINKDQAYLLHITLETGAHTLNYYTRILWTDRDYTKSMEDVAFRFTTGSFDSTNSKDITTYLETKDTADNSSLGHVDLHSSFNQIIWGKTGMQPKGRFYMVHRPFRLPEILAKMTQYGIEPKRMRLVHPYIDKEPNMVLIEALKGGNSRVTVEPPLIVYKEPGVYTENILKIYDMI